MTLECHPSVIHTLGHSPPKHIQGSKIAPPPPRDIKSRTCHPKIHTNGPFFYPLRILYSPVLQLKNYWLHVCMIKVSMPIGLCYDIKRFLIINWSPQLTIVPRLRGQHLNSSYCSAFRIRAWRETERTHTRPRQPHLLHLTPLPLLTSSESTHHGSSR